MRRPIPALAAVSLLLALTAGCQGGAGATAPRSTVPATPAPAVTVIQKTVTQAALVAALPAAPAGAGPWSGRQGGITRQQYLTAEFGAANAAELLGAEQQAGLLTGARRSWRQHGGVLVSVTLADYRDRAGAKAMYLRIQYGLELADAGDVRLVLPGAADSYGIGDPRPDKAGDTRSDLVALAGKELLHVVVKAPGSVDSAVVKDLALRTYAQLCGLSDCAAGSAS